jgi:hypothetical protein
LLNNLHVLLYSSVVPRIENCSSASTVLAASSRNIRPTKSKPQVAELTIEENVLGKLHIANSNYFYNDDRLRRDKEPTDDSLVR